MKTNSKILLVDDDLGLLKLLSIRLNDAGYKIDTVSSAESALNYLDLERPQLVISDIQMGGMNGMALFEKINEKFPALPVIILTAHGTIPDAVAAVQRGVFGYLTKPFDSKILLAQIQKALNNAPQTTNTQNAQPLWCKEIITQCADMKDILSKAELVAKGDASVLLYGESGVGKELFARAIHSASGRCQKPFVAVNCSAIPEHLLETELFGHVKGAFTGAIRNHEGLFQLAEGGTLFLDEIGDMPLSLQVKLLRAIQEKQIRSVGSAQFVPVDVRFISATHRDLKEEIAKGSFREDLYYRIDVISLKIPALSQRREDIPLLANHFLELFANRYQQNIVGFSPDAMEILLTASWPGNVRQLMNVIEQCVVLSAASLIPPALVYDAINMETSQLKSFEEAKKQFERDYLVRVLKITSGNVTHAARIAKRNRTEFYKLLQRHQIDYSMYKVRALDPQKDKIGTQA
ncbi:MAG: sigma 54-interacting transcriptional regulator [Burkholderiales bacterium]|uniref:sigma 54-interacting transcriptional regulator n=1 Tax=Nitrosomonas sp. TaxID=42353 RepID=UPI001D8E8188|nr:sigma 54-interacting transcriptional regulator [Nitrosomonas sp.]MCB1948247.1 sigma 54-interacting transcriptional regulator [Nitrosomonas sp.]MCP5244377.1 sigma 54-interacting transcriptional regulator [Burkholderiales bacterium]MCP5246671.1 sigma 54-interacting transcriptional regulator [Burkholderiales bacterium]